MGLVRGKRVSSARYTARHLAVRNRKHRRDNAERWAVTKLVICGVIFVFIVAVKLMFPGMAEEFGRTASRLIGNHADFKEVFSAIGRAASGEEQVEESLQDVYAAVFNPSSENKDTPVIYESDKKTEGKKVLLAEAGTRQDDDLTELIRAEVVSYSGPALPENVDPELHELNFTCVAPVIGVVTSSFGWRNHPVDGERRFHYGVDLGADSGTDICAFADGEIFAVGESSTLGKYIIVLHGDGYRTLYAHCSAVLKLSGKVSAGEVIARVGESGRTTGPHLHFELMSGQWYLDPTRYVDLG